MISIVTAVASDGAFGLQQSLPWRVKEELHFFKKLTFGHTLLVGKNTKLPSLPNRNVVRLDRDSCLSNYPDSFLIGGKTVIETLQNHPLIKRWYLSTITFPKEIEADTYFHPVLTGWRLVEERVENGWCSINQCSVRILFQTFERD
jgi:dihydrofolate reductase